MPDFDQFIRDMEQVQKSLVPELLKSEGASLDKAYELAQEYSSGTHSQAQHDADGNPYGFGAETPSGRTRGAIPYGDLGIVNEQTGVFKSGWTKLSATWSADVIAAALVNVSRVSQFLKWGTPKMKPRPIDDKVAAAVEPERMRNLDRAFTKIFSKFR